MLLLFSDYFEESLIVLDSAREQGLTPQQRIFTTPFVYGVDVHPKYHFLYLVIDIYIPLSPCEFILI